MARETMAKGEGADGDGGQVAVPQGAWAGETVAGDAAVQGGGPGHGGDRHGGSEDGGAPPCGVRNPPAPGPGDAAPGSQAQGPVTGAEGTGAYMVRLGPQEFTPAGLARIEATVVPLGPGGVPPGPGVLFSWHEGQASLGSGQAGQGQYVSREAEAGEPRVTVEAGGYSRVELTARLDIGGVVHYAQADFNLFAREGSRSRPSAAGAPGWPFFELGSEAPLYWPQTGQTFHVRILGLDLPPGPMAVWEEGGGAPAAVIVPDEGGLYSYAPPHDPALDRLGATASKNLVFVHPLGGGGTASLSFAVHRSRVERRRLGAGLAVFLAGLAGGGWFLAARRRRVVPCA
ncbi:MAG: hypothetical protein LBP92_00310 [Deltaproteobacteria bacterium]|nr:hypothetical protein [Deltaproteobacteria bacterium]